MLLAYIKSDLRRLGCISNAPSITLHTTSVLATRCRNHDNRNNGFFISSPPLILGMQGKGYPDIATRQLVRMLSDQLPATYALLRHRTIQSYMLYFLSTRVPVVALVDGDAHGLDIVSVYKFGSMALRHEANKLAAPRVGCIGIWASELASYVPLPCLFQTRAHQYKVRNRQRQLNTDLARRREEGSFR